MPGKHAPESPASFYASLVKSFGGLAAVLALIVAAGTMALSGDEQTDPPSDAPPAAATRTEPASREKRKPKPPVARRSPRTPAETTLPPSQVSVEVLNGTRRSGLARTTAERVRDEGYRVTNVGNALATPRSTIEYVPGALDEARALRATFPEFRALKKVPSLPGSMLRMIVGSDYP